MGAIPPTPSDPIHFQPESYPPFPLEVQPCVELKTVSLAALEANDASEEARLLSICKDSGFFYLDVSNTGANHLTDEAKTLTRISEPFFQLPMEVKMRYPFGRKPCSLLGYKPAGAVKADAHGKKGDTAQFMNCGKDDVLDIPRPSPTELPDIYMEPDNHDLLARFQVQAHQTGLDILSSLAKSLGLSRDTFDDMNRPDRPSDSHVRFTYGPPRMTDGDPQIQSPGHTDFGSITLLFNWLGGLQIWSESNHGESFDNALGSELGPESGRKGQWLWVIPKPDHIIVNLGDCVVKNTGGLLCAGRHRVVPAPGVQGQFSRHSLVYFVRPADDQVIKRISGGAIPPFKEGEVEEQLTTSQWTQKQFMGLRDGAKKS